MNAKGRKSKQSTSGFSLIELMVVVAIVALLTGIAMPSYKTYLAQSKVTEIFSLASDQMNAFTTTYNAGSPTLTCNSSGLGTYIGIVTYNIGSTAGAGCSSLTGGNAGVKTVAIVLNAAAGTGIDPSLANVVLWFTPSVSGSTTGDTSNYNWKWTCTFLTSSSSNPTTAASYLAPGNCTSTSTIPADRTL